MIMFKLIFRFLHIIIPLFLKLRLMDIDIKYLIFECFDSSIEAGTVI